MDSVVSVLWSHERANDRDIQIFDKCNFVNWKWSNFVRSEDAQKVSGDFFLKFIHFLNKKGFIF